jgi:cathepsin L
MGMIFWFLISAFVSLSWAESLATEDTIILIRPEEMRIVPKKVLEHELEQVAEMQGETRKISEEQQKFQEQIRHLFPIPSEKAPKTEERPEERKTEDRPEERKKEEEPKKKELTEEQLKKDEERKKEEEQRKKDEELRKEEEQHKKDEVRKKEELRKKKLEESYIVFGYVKLIFDNTTEPFTLWFDADKKRSRVDLGGRGTFSTLQFEKENELYRFELPAEGSAFRKPVCIKTEGTNEDRVKVLKAVPDLSKFERISETRWKREVKDKSTVHTFWLTIDKETQEPITLEVLWKSTLIDKIIDHYLVEYKRFLTKKPEDTVFELPKDIKCHSVVGLEEIDHLERDLVDQRHFFVNPFGVFVDPDLHRLYEHEVGVLFEGFCRRYKKRYESEEEKELRRAAFSHNYRFINVVNRAGFSYRVKVNWLADRTNDELRKMLGVRGVGDLSKAEHCVKFDSERHNLLQVKNIPEWIDWRNLGVLTPVRNQRACGSDWAIAATKVLESTFQIRSNDLVKLSEQELIDCSHITGNQECHRGTTWQAFEYITKFGLASEATYGPLTTKVSECRREDTKISAKIKNWVLVDKDERKLKEALVKNGPVASFIDAGHKSFFFYASGIYREEDCRVKPEEMNHAVLVAGFSELDESRKYWLIENTFGTDWGLNGFMLLDRSGSNTCGILNAPTFVEM